MKRIIVILLTLALLLNVMPGFANTEAPGTEAPATTEAPAESASPETTAEPTKEPVQELTTSPVDDSTALPDGEYVPSGCTGGSEKVKFSCPKVTVKDGKASATLVISSSKYDYIKASGNKYETSAYADGGVYAEIPVDLNADNRIVGHTTAMGGKEIEYTICITLNESGIEEPTAEPTAEPTPTPTAEPTAEPTPAPTEEPGADTEHTVATDNKMFKIIRSSLTLKDSGYTAQITLSGTGYDMLYCGSAADAANDSANWIAYSSAYEYDDAGETKTGYVFTIPVAAVNQPIPLAAHSVKKDEWMDRNVTFSVAVAEPTPEPTEEPGIDTEHTVATDNKMFKIIRSSLTLKDGGYTAQITLSGTGYDMLYCGSAADAANDSANWIAYSSAYEYDDAGETKTGYVFTIPVAAVNQPIPLAAHSVKKDEWMDRNVTFTVATSEPTNKPTAAPTPAPTPVILDTPGKVNSSTSLKDGSYTPDKFSWSGGSGRTSIACSSVTVRDGKAYATISFSSDSYAYVKANGQKYYGSVVGGRSTFEIPVKLNANNKVVGMTTAMSADHEIAYTIYVYIEDAKDKVNSASNPEAEITGLNHVSTDAIANAKLFKIHRYEGGYIAIDVADAGKYLIVPEGAELPVGIEEEVAVIQLPILSVHSASEGALQMLQMIFADVTEASVAVAAWNCAEADYTALLLGACDLAIMPETFADDEAADAAIADVKERLSLLGIPMFVDRSANEENEAAKLEWIKVYGILLGCEEAANACYEAAVAELEVQA